MFRHADGGVITEFYLLGTMKARWEVPPDRAQLPGSRPERHPGCVSAGSAADGLGRNVTLPGRHGVSGGFKMLRYRDGSERKCAYYDVALLWPLCALTLA